MTQEQFQALMHQTQQLLDEGQRLRREVALAYAWPVEPPSPHVEQAPPEFIAEANRRGLWKLFR